MREQEELKYLREIQKERERQQNLRESDFDDYEEDDFDKSGPNYESDGEDVLAPIRGSERSPRESENYEDPSEVSLHPSLS